jgi:hypothetical protein
LSAHLGDWQPSTPDERLDRMESLASIQQLAFRYGLAVDSKNLDAMAALWSPEVRGGREGIRRSFTGAMSGFRSSIHFVVNHIIDFQDADHASGIVYCRDELEMERTGEWHVGTIQYWDTYLRTDGEWGFTRRRFHRWYIADALTRPAHGLGVPPPAEGRLTTHQLPEAFESFHAFRAAHPRP